MNTSLSLITLHRLSMLPPAVLANMVVRQTLALDDLLRGGARLYNAVSALEDGYRLHAIADQYAPVTEQGQGSGPVPHITIDQVDEPTTISPAWPPPA